MRDAFAKAITRLAWEDGRIVVLSGDIGNRMFDDFKARYPERFYNCGVAEANMMSLASGIALSGLRPFVYSITPFVTTRCLEQIRVDLCHQHAPVTIVGVGGGLSYANLGATHHSCEDIAFLRVLPQMTVVCPGDATEVRLATRAVLNLDGPAYIRLGKKGEPLVHREDPRFVIGEGIVVREGRDVCLLSTGNLLPVAVEASEELSKAGVSAQLVSFHTVKPLDVALLRRAFESIRVVTTVEEHSVLGGLGGSVAEWLSEQPSTRARLCRIGTADAFLHEAGEQDHARERLGLTPKHIVEATLRLYGALLPSEDR